MIVVVNSITQKEAIELGHIEVEINILLEYLFDLSSKSKTFCKWCTMKTSSQMAAPVQAA